MTKSKSITSILIKSSESPYSDSGGKSAHHIIMAESIYHSSFHFIFNFYETGESPSAQELVFKRQTTKA